MVFGRRSWIWGKKGVFWFTDTLNPAQLIELTRGTEQLGYGALWHPEVLGYGYFGLASLLLAHTEKLIVAAASRTSCTRSHCASTRCQSSRADDSCSVWASLIPSSSRMPRPLIRSARGDDAGLPRRYGQSSGECARA